MTSNSFIQTTLGDIAARCKRSILTLRLTSLKSRENIRILHKLNSWQMIIQTVGAIVLQEPAFRDDGPEPSLFVRDASELRIFIVDLLDEQVLRHPVDVRRENRNDRF